MATGKIDLMVCPREQKFYGDMRYDGLLPE
jgi:hypothetical protein